MPPEDGARVLRYLSDLAREPPLPVGTPVKVEEDRKTYYSVGNVRPEIANALGWLQQGNIWMPDHVLRDIKYGHLEFPRPIHAFAWALVHATNVNEEVDRPGVIRFLVDANQMRSSGFLTARSPTIIDAIVELRQAAGETIIRAFHLSPTKHGPRGRRIWP